MRVLVIEDDPAIGSVLIRGLSAEGHRAELCADGNDGLWRAMEGDYDAIVLDLLLPGLNGYQVCARLREEGIGTPILVLTAKQGDLDHVDLLELGADAFLSKPATIEVVAANLRALVRRGSEVRSAVHRAGDLSYDEVAQTCRLQDEIVELTGREHDVLLELFRSPGFCGRERLLHSVWGLDFDGDPGIIDVYIRRLRSKLGRQRIENRRGLGYRLIDA